LILIFYFVAVLLWWLLFPNIRYFNL